MFRVKTTVSIVLVKNITGSIVSVHRIYEIMRSKTLLYLPPPKDRTGSGIVTGRTTAKSKQKERRPCV
jgi:hypothetical protein